MGAPFGTTAERFGSPGGGVAEKCDIGPGHYSSTDRADTPKRCGASPPFGGHEDRWTAIYRDDHEAESPGPGAYYRRNVPMIARPATVASGCYPHSRDAVGFMSGARRSGLWGLSWRGRKDDV